MMADLRFEGLVRPFQTRDLSPPKLEPSISDILAEGKTVKFEWGKGKSTGGSVGQWNSSTSVTLYMTKQQREQSQDVNKSTTG
jgi:hypothetical protein